jgi:hypothetical protein
MQHDNKTTIKQYDDGIALTTWHGNNYVMF